ncbi:chaperonin 10-like protein [Lipomyces oligophaga]|uniref:chaperonin 10-like protein n=1 Tax=Lipomyces oligophaga TaxID=45792 RepID=UPI0034CD13A2
MKEVIVHVDPEIHCDLIDTEIPKPGPKEVLIKVNVSGMNPKDWKFPKGPKGAHNSGDDIAGTIVEVGSEVIGFRDGDRVAAFHVMGEPHGSFAEYAIAWASTTFLIPDKISFEEAATLPLVCLTAVYGMFDLLGLPFPTRPATTEIPLLIYGASTSVGLVSIQYAKLAGIGPIIGVAGAGCQAAKDMGCDFVIDYRENKDVSGSIRAVLKDGQKLKYVWDCVSEKGSVENSYGALDLDDGGAILVGLLGFDTAKFDTSKVTIFHEFVAAAHGDDPARRDLAFVACQLLTKWLAEDKFKPLKYKVMDGGLTGVEAGLKLLYDGKVSATKLVYRISDTPGL